MGGAVVIPHLYNGHNKTFFFGAYEGWRHPAQQTIFEVVPSTAMKQGDFSNYNSEGFAALSNPFTGTPYLAMRFPRASSQIAQNTLKQFYPDPNIGNPASYTDDGTPNYQANVDASGHSDQFDVRGDQYFGAQPEIPALGQVHVEGLSH